MPESSNVKRFNEVSMCAEELRLWDEDDIYRLGIHQILARLDNQSLKDLPVEEWVQLPALPDFASLSSSLIESSDNTSHNIS